MPTVAYDTPLIVILSLFVSVLTGLGYAKIKDSNAKARVSEADAEQAHTHADATDGLFEHYRKELADLREKVTQLGTRLNNTEAELSKVEALYRNSAAGERRYREAFAELLRANAMLLATARDYVPAERLTEVEKVLTNLMMALARPLEPHEEGEESL